ncbi:MAG: alpha/beta hydrolase [Deltaproteobacteria bacterium]
MALKDIDVPIETRRTRGRDGTGITYYVAGTGPKRWLMPPAMGAPLMAMKYVIERFAREYTIVSWDQRGFYGSDAPGDPDAQSVDDHLGDMHAVVAAEGLERFVLGGWSMGVQLSLEYYARRQADVQALVLISGPFERALASVAPIPSVEAFALAVLRGAGASSRVLNPLARTILGAPGVSRVLHRAGLLAANPEFFERLLAEFSTVDWGRYFTMTRHLHEHSAAAHLPLVNVPTLIVTGTNDFMTPVSVAEQMHRRIPGSELFVLARATHYIVAEFPKQLTDRIALFLAGVAPDQDRVEPT